MRYLAETLINEMHIVSYLRLKICFIMISITFGLLRISLSKLTLGLFLRYSYNLGDLHPNILIEAILIKKSVYFILRILPKDNHREIKLREQNSTSI